MLVFASLRPKMRICIIILFAPLSFSMIGIASGSLGVPRGMNLSETRSCMIQILNGQGDEKLAWEDEFARQESTRQYTLKNKCHVEDFVGKVMRHDFLVKFGAR